MTRKSKAAASRSHEEATVESLRKDPTFAAEYLNSILEDGDQEELMLALRRMSKAFGGVPKLARGGVERPHPLPDAFAEKQSRTEEPEGASTGDGNAAYRPVAAETRGVNHGLSGPIRPRSGWRRSAKIVSKGNRHLKLLLKISIVSPEF